MVKSTRSPFHYPALLDPALLDPDAASCEAAKERLLRRLQWRLLPLLAMGYGFGLMDRANIGFAELTMADELCLSASDFGLASGIFFCSSIVSPTPPRDQEVCRSHRLARMD